MRYRKIYGEEKIIPASRVETNLGTRCWNVSRLILIETVKDILKQIIEEVYGKDDEYQSRTSEMHRGGIYGRDIAG